MRAMDTLVDLLRVRSMKEGDRLALAYLRDGEDVDAALTYRDLDVQARAVASALAEAGLQPGDRAILLFPPSLSFMTAFFGCLYAGVLAIPLGIPLRASLVRTRLQPVIDDAAPAAILTVDSHLAEIRGAVEAARVQTTATWLTVDTVDRAGAQHWADPGTKGEDVAYLQYTSGSTSTPKGVMVTHANLLHNSREAHSGFGFTRDSVAVSWLPLDHDMGLIMGALQPLVHGFPGFLMSPAAFVRKPFRWLSAISRLRATHSYAPNFAYDLCVERISDADRAGLDLSSWKVAENAAEPVRAGTIARFTEAFAPHGFDPSAWLPLYGLAEATLVMTSDAQGDGATTITVDPAELEQGRVVMVDPSTPRARMLVASGGIRGRGFDVRIVRSGTHVEAVDGEIGEIWAAGPSIAVGYWQRPEDTKATFGATIRPTGEGPFLRTGDLGFVIDGRIYIAGRAKDVMIVRGRNIYPQDVELAVEAAHPAIRGGCTAAFAYDDGEEEAVVVVAEARIPEGADRLPEDEAQEIVELVRHAVWSHFDIRPDDVRLIRPRTIFKTSSGKIQRSACRTAFLTGSLEEVA